MPKIFTILLNPTIDQIIYIDNFEAGGTYKSDNVIRNPVGKAISVALTLNSLQIPVHVIALIGKKEMGEYSKFLNSKNINNTLLPIEGFTRSNITIIDSKKNQSTHLRMPGFQVTGEDLKRLHNFLEIIIQSGDYVIFSGSNPPGTPIEYYFTPSEIINRKHAYFILDTSGLFLTNLHLYHPYLIKANIEEMGLILGQSLLSSPELIHNPSDEDLYGLLDKCSELSNYPSKINILTLAQYGSLIFSRDFAYYAVFSLKNAPYTVGCGDAFLGGFISGLYRNDTIENCIKLATACGAANTQTNCAGNIEKSCVENFVQQVQIKKLK
jgi:1-phosphofructokinase family hexose kinase